MAWNEGSPVVIGDYLCRIKTWLWSLNYPEYMGKEGERKSFERSTDPWEITYVSSPTREVRVVRETTVTVGL